MQRAINSNLLKKNNNNLFSIITTQPHGGLQSALVRLRGSPEGEPTLFEYMKQQVQ